MASAKFYLSEFTQYEFGDRRFPKSPCTKKGCGLLSEYCGKPVVRLAPCWYETSANHAIGIILSPAIPFAVGKYETVS